MTESSYRTPAVSAEHEIARIKGSRFIGRAAPAEGEDEANALVEAARRDHPDARHHAWAWRLGPGSGRFRYSDDGEPSGSAGRPILAQLDGRELVNAAVVVVRYFGGTKLGVGGLARAYGSAAAAALDRAGVRTVTVTRALRIVFAYELSGAVQGVLAAWSLVPEASDYGEAVGITVRVPAGRAGAFVREIRDRTAGRAEVREATGAGPTPR